MTLAYLFGLTCGLIAYEVFLRVLVYRARRRAERAQREWEARMHGWMESLSVVNPALRGDAQTSEKAN